MTVKFRLHFEAKSGRDWDGKWLGWVERERVPAAGAAAPDGARADAAAVRRPAMSEGSAYALAVARGEA